MYRIVAIPDREDVKEIDLGIPTYGEIKAIDQEIYSKLRSDGEILEKIAPLVVREKYLEGKEYVSTANPIPFSTHYSMSGYSCQCLDFSAYGFYALCIKMVKGCKGKDRCKSGAVPQL